MPVRQHDTHSGTAARYTYDTVQQHAIASMPPVHVYERRAFMPKPTRPQIRCVTTNKNTALQ